MTRTVVELAVALALSVLVHRADLAVAGGLETTLVALPLLVAGFRAFDRRLGRLRGRRNATPTDRFRALRTTAVGTGLVLLTLGRAGLGVEISDGWLAAGWALLLALAVARRLPPLRVALGRRLGSRPDVAFFLLPLLVYLALLPWSTGQRAPDGDEPYFLLLTHSLVDDADVDLRDEYAEASWRRFLDRPLEPQLGDPRGKGGQQFSRHGAMLPLLLAPGYAVGGRWGSLVTMALFAAALAWSFLRLLRHAAADDPATAFRAWALFALAPPLLVYAYQVWVEVPAALLTALALDRILDLPRRPLERPRDLAGLLALLVALPLLKLRLVLVAGGLLALLMWRGVWRARLSRRALTVLVGGLVVALAALGAYNAWRYGHPLRMHRGSEVLAPLVDPFQTVLGLLGLFFDTAFGLFASSPIWILIVPGVWALLRRSPRALAAGLVVVGPYFLGAASRPEWYGGWSPPFRYGMVVLPVLGLALVPALAARHRPAVRVVTAALLVLTAVLTLAVVAVPGWTYHFADGGSRLLHWAGSRLGADVGRLFPSAVRPRLATWVWAGVVLLLVPLAWRVGGRDRGRSTTASLLGASVLLALVAAVPPTAARFPTTVVEAEDGWVAKRGGGPSPSRWTIQRVLYRSGWILTSGAELTVPVVPAGDRVTLRLEVSFVENIPGEPYDLVVHRGDEELERWPATRRPRWQSVEMGPFEWRDGEDLVITGPRNRFRDVWRGNAVVVDRIELDWE